MQIRKSVYGLAFSTKRQRLVLFCVIGMLSLHLLLFVQLWSRIGRGYSDFTAFYTAGKMLQEHRGASLYDLRSQSSIQQQFAANVTIRRGPLPYIHPPFEALLFYLLAWQPYTTAFLVWDLLNGIALFAVSLLLRSYVNALFDLPGWKFLLLFLAFFPAFLNLILGQDAILLLLLCTLGFRALSRRSDFSAGCWFGLGVFRFHLVVPLVLLLSIGRRRQLPVGFALVGLILGVLSAVIAGWDSLLRYPKFIVHIARTPGLGDVPPKLMPNLRGLIEGWPLEFPRHLPEIVTIVASIGVLAWAAQKFVAAKHSNINLEFSLAVVVSLLVGWHTNTHDLVLLILPFLLLFGGYVAALRSGMQPDSGLLPPILLLTISPLWLLLWFGIGRTNLMGIVLLWLAWEIGRGISRHSIAVQEAYAGSLQ